MDYEKAYKEALERAKELLYDEDVEEIFHEHIESEDKKIRKALSECVEDYRCKGVKNFFDVPIENVLSWLEKQKPVEAPQWMIDFLGDHRRHFGTPMDHDERKDVDGKLLAIAEWLKGNPNIEQKPVEWSEEDEKMKSLIISTLTSMGTLNLERYHNMNFDEVKNWFKSFCPKQSNDYDRGFKDGVSAEKYNNSNKQKWSEEDEKLLKLTLDNLKELEDAYGEAYGKVGDCISWLKSLKPQQHWKPSEQNIRDLEWCLSMFTEHMGTEFNRLKVFVDELKTLHDYE